MTKSTVVEEVSISRESFVFGNRIPKEYFIVLGTGESDSCGYPNAFDEALKKGGGGVDKSGLVVSNFITYSSIIPKEAFRVEVPNKFVHGQVVESIMAVQYCKKGERATAGLLIVHLHKKKSGEKIGGLVLEFHGHEDLDKAKELLMGRMDEMIKIRYGDLPKSDQPYVKDFELYLDSIVPEKNHGAAVAALCYTSYEYPRV